MTNDTYDKYNDLIRRMAVRLTKTCPGLREDAVNAGWVGLLEAVGRRDPNIPDINFEGLIILRVRGSIIDFLRKQDYLNRNQRKDAKRIDRARLKTERRLGRAVTSEELADALEIPLKDLQVRQTHIAQAFKTKVELVPQQLEGQQVSPELEVQDVEVYRKLQDLIPHLSERHQQILEMRYQQDMGLREIGVVLDVSESRVSQCHAAALDLLREHLENRKRSKRKQRSLDRLSY